jgi:hypothetical protein
MARRRGGRRRGRKASIATTMENPFGKGMRGGKGRGKKRR